MPMLFLLVISDGLMPLLIARFWREISERI